MSVFYTSVERYKNDILFCGYKHGKRIKEKIQYKPTLYISTTQPSTFKTLSGLNVDEIKPGTMSECRAFVERYADVSNFQVYGNTNYVHQFISDAFHAVPLSWNRDTINVTTIDIEVESDKGFPRPEEANFPVTAITVKNNIDNIFYVWGCGDWSAKNTALPHLKVKYIKCTDERDLLKKFINHWTDNYPDVITGWNSRMFDTVYMINRLSKVLDDEYAKQMSPWGLLSQREIVIGGQPHQFYEISGIQQLDYIDCFKKFAYSYGTQESYKLDHIAYVVLGERKLDYSEYGSLNTLYKENHQKFIDYNIRDVDIVDRLEDKMGLISLAMTIAYKALVNYSEAFGSVGVWDALLFNELRKRRIVVPPKTDNTKERKIEGAYVKDPQVGGHQWVVSFDLNSLYPHIMLQYNMSPETIVNDKQLNVSVDKLLNKQYYMIPETYSMAATGQYFSKLKKGIVPEIIQKLYDERSLIKKQMLETKQLLESTKDNKYELEKRITTDENRQMAIKILMNSLYGALSNEFFRYYDTRIAESITVSGQLTIRWAEKMINKFMNESLKTEDVDYVIAIDTDSLYIRMDKIVELSKAPDPVAFLDKLCKQTIEPLLSEGYQDLCSYMNAYEQKMVMKREVIADKGIWTGKKHYALNVHNSEGVQYAQPKLKIMGIEVVRSSTPQVCRDMLKETIKTIMSSDEETTQNYIKQCKEKFKSLSAEDVSFPRTVSEMEKWYDAANLYRKGCPIHVRGSLLYNKHVDKYNVSRKYEKINSGEKIKFCYLKLPNYIQENTIAFKTVLPDEFRLREFIDYDTQFEKAYLEPLKAILDAIGWQSEKRSTLEDFFK